MTQPFRYWAFLSYSHADEAVARWLHRALETYRVPTRLVGRAHPDGAVPRRIFPIFRDRDELPSSAELGGVINAALQVSRYQIVVCSPPAAASRWVNEEIKTFKSMGRDARVLALIVDGEPNATDNPKLGLLECFPPALRHRVDAAGNLTTERTEPIAADARKGKDGRREALLKLISGLIGVNLDELKQREKVRQRWRVAGYAALTAAVLTMLGGVWQWQEQRRAEQARADRIARDIDLGRKELAGEDPARAAAYFGEAYGLGDRSIGLRYQLAKAMRAVDPLVRVFRQSTTPASNWTAATISPDGLRVVTASNDRNTAVVWDAQSGRTLMELDHGAWIGWLGYRPDGKILYTSGDKAVIFWDAADGRRLGAVEGVAHPGAMLRVGLPEDARRIFIRHADRSVHVHDSQTGAPISVLREAEMDPGLGFSADGEMAFSATRGRIRLWRVRDAKVVGELPGHSAAIRDLKVSADGARLASSAIDGSVRVWDLDSRQLRSELRVSGPVGILGFSDDGRRLAFFGEDNSVSLWDVAREPSRPIRSQPRSQPRRWSADGAWVSMEDRSNTFRIWSAATGEPRLTLGGHAGEIINALFTPSGSRVLSVGRDGTARLWQLDFEELPVIRESAWPSDIRYSTDGQRVIAVLSDGRITERDAQTGALLRTARNEHHRLFQDARLNRDGTRAWVLIRDADFELWDLVTGQTIARLTGHDPGAELWASFDETGRWLITADGSMAQIWDASNGKLVSTLRATHPPKSPVGWLAFAPDGNRLAIADGQPAVRVIEFPSGKLVRSLESPGIVPRTVSWGVAEIAAGDGEDLVAIYDAATGRRRSELRVGTRYVELGPIPGRMVTSSDDGPVWWDLARGTSRLLGGHSAQVMMLAYSPDGTRLASASQDRTIRLWDAQTGELLDILGGHYSTVSRLDFSPDGRRLLSASYDDTARQWGMIPPETRSAEQIQAILRCKLPWRVDGENLRAAWPDTSCS
jgi:WD40 repeat protein